MSIKRKGEKNNQFNIILYCRPVMTNPLPMTTGRAHIWAGQLNQEAKYSYYGAILYWCIGASDNAYILLVLCTTCPSIHQSVSPSWAEPQVWIGWWSRADCNLELLPSGICSSACAIRQTECWTFDESDTELGGGWDSSERHDNEPNIFTRHQTHTLNKDLNTYTQESHQKYT